MVLCLSSLSFLDSVIYGGSSDNPLYVIHTVDNMAKVHRSNPKGFVNISCVRWLAAPLKSVHPLIFLSDDTHYTLAFLWDVLGNL